MLTGLVVLPRLIPPRLIGLIARGHRAVALENLALHQPLALLTRSGKRPQLRTWDRLFGVALASAWPDWRTALLVVQPETVVRWPSRLCGTRRGTCDSPILWRRPESHAQVRFATLEAQHVAAFHPILMT